MRTQIDYNSLLILWLSCVSGERVDLGLCGKRIMRRALGLTGAMKQGAPGDRYSHIPCHKRRPFSRRKFLKSDSFRWCAIGANKYTKSWQKRQELELIPWTMLLSTTHRNWWYREEIILVSFLGWWRSLFTFRVGTFIAGHKDDPVQSVEKFCLGGAQTLQVFHPIENVMNKMRRSDPVQQKFGRSVGMTLCHLFTHLLCKRAAAQCMTCGRADWTSLHLGMDCRADVSEGESPNWMFCTRTFSKDWNGGGDNLSSQLAILGFSRVAVNCSGREY